MSEFLTRLQNDEQLSQAYLKYLEGKIQKIHDPNKWRRIGFRNQMVLELIQEIPQIKELHEAAETIFHSTMFPDLKFNQPKGGAQE